MARARPRFVLLTILIAVLALGAAVFHDRNPLARAGERYAASIATASAATYVTLRTLNAVLSTAQEVEVGASLGVSGSVQPGKVLEPVDDTIERIASVVFMLMLVSGVLAVAMGPVGAVGAGMIALACLLWLVGRGGALRPAVRQLGVFGTFLVLGLPLCLVIADALADPLTGRVMARHEAVIAEIVADVLMPAADALEAATQDDRWFGGLRDTVSAGTDYLVLARRIMAEADVLIASYLAILAVLVFRIFLLPLLLVGAVWLLARTFARG